MPFLFRRFPFPIVATHGTTLLVAAASAGGQSFDSCNFSEPAQLGSKDDSSEVLLGKSKFVTSLKLSLEETFSLPPALDVSDTTDRRSLQLRSVPKPLSGKLSLEAALDLNSDVLESDCAIQSEDLNLLEETFSPFSASAFGGCFECPLRSGFLCDGRDKFGWVEVGISLGDLVSFLSVVVQDFGNFFSFLFA